MRVKKWQDGWLTARWSKKERDILYNSPDRPDGHLLHGALCTTFMSKKDLVSELVARGYDITTLQFCVRRKP